MQKLDTIAVPAIVEDAMENWGLVTYDPAFSLVDPSIQPPPLDAVQIIAQVVCHETAHHWHGNMITCPW
jgi:aminopeptidase N